MRVVVLLSIVLASAALAGDTGFVPGPRVSKERQAPPKRATTIVEAWKRLPSIDGHGCGRDLVFDYGAQGGMRNFFCRALTVMSWRSFLALAPTAPFAKGPHGAGKLQLQSKRDFGRYDPKFVRWATTALIPAADDAALRAETQPTYDRLVAPLARTYWRVHRALSSDPAWIERERRFYLGAADRGDVDALGRTLDLYHDVLGTADDDWGGHDPNHVRSATLWWLRRHHDATATLWAQGLERLLTTYDAAWLAQEKERAPRRLPVRAREATPEYR